jgi:hypothetical protein
MSKGYDHIYITPEGKIYSHYGTYRAIDGRGNKSQRDDEHSPLCPCGWKKGEKRWYIRKTLNNHWSRSQARK